MSSYIFLLNGLISVVSGINSSKRCCSCFLTFRVVAVPMSTIHIFYSDVSSEKCHSLTNCIVHLFKALVVLLQYIRLEVVMFFVTYPSHHLEQYRFGDPECQNTLNSIKNATLPSVEKMLVGIIWFSWNLEMSQREDICKIWESCNIEASSWAAQWWGFCCNSKVEVHKEWTGVDWLVGN